MLKTTLNETVNDNSLAGIGEIRVEVSAFDASQTGYARAFKIVTEEKSNLFRVFGGKLYSDLARTVAYGDNPITVANQGQVYVGDDVNYIFVNNKYSITAVTCGCDKFNLGKVSDWLFDPSKMANFSSGNAVLDGTLDDFANCVNLTTFASAKIKGDLSSVSGLTKLKSFSSMSNTGIYGDIAGFKNCAVLETLELSNDTKIEGSLNDLGGIITLTKIWLSGTNVDVDADALVASQVAAGRTSGTLSVIKKDGTSFTHTFG